jgi:hypothetical protein
MTVKFLNIPEQILQDDWSAYDRAKSTYMERFVFDGNESWEVDFLVGKIRKFNPSLTVSYIRSVILLCSNQMPAPRPRDQFVRFVMTKI